MGCMVCLASPCNLSLPISPPLHDLCEAHAHTTWTEWPLSCTRPSLQSYPSNWPDDFCPAPLHPTCWPHGHYPCHPLTL